MMETDKYLTVEQFAGLLENIFYDAGKGTYKAGCDVPQRPEEFIKRRTAAGIIHHALLCTGETDEEHIEAAFRLKDLYTCKTCVNHIAQVYAKGIMTARQDGSFGVDEKITCKEAGEALSRVTDEGLRRKPKPPAPAGWSVITWQEAERMLEADRRILLVDVRSREEYSEEHRKGSVNAPLQTLLTNPYCVCADRTAVLLLYCKSGYKSRIAAELLAKAGYDSVYAICGSFSDYKELF